MDNQTYNSSYSDVRLECYEGKPTKKVRIFMNSRGCRYAKRKECIECGFFNMSNEHLTSDEIISNFYREFNKYDFNQYPILSVYTPGSFLDDTEVLPDERANILEQINITEGITNVIIESRPEFVTKEKVKNIVELLSDKIVNIAMGLESSNDYIRNNCVNKHFTWDDYVRAANIIKKYCNLRSYVLMKPPFLTESEAINDAINSIRDAFSIGSESVFLEICNVQMGTPLESLYNLDLYKPARLWSVLDVLFEFEGKKVFVGGINDYPVPIVEASNCELCTEKVKKELVKYNSTLDLSKLRKLNCKCRHSQMLPEFHSETSKLIILPENP